MAVEQQANAFVTRSQGAQTSVNSSNASLSLASATNSLRSATITDDVNGKKLHICVDVVSVFSSAADTPVYLEASIDGTSWATIATLSTDFVPSTAGPRFFTADLTDVSSVPYFAIHFNASAKGIGTSGTCTFHHYFT